MVGAEGFAEGLFFCAATGTAIAQSKITRNRKPGENEVMELLDREGLIIAKKNQ
jgi:hypothetical protein